MEYPIYIDGEKCGVLTVTQEGLRTRFAAQCDKHHGIVRVFIYGEGRSAYLGVLCPDGESMALSKAFTKNEMSRFPRKIEYASNAEIRKEAPQEKKDTKWIMSTCGCLVCFEGGVKYVAIPADGKRLEKTGLVRHIDGGDYLVFRK